MFKKLRDDAILPQSKTKFSAGYDICAIDDYTIKNGKTTIVKTGIGLNLNLVEDKQETFFGLYLRSSLGVKGLFMPNGVGVIDSDYLDEIGVILTNSKKEPFKIKKGDRIAQLIVQPYIGCKKYDKKNRLDELRNGGYGSTS